VSKWSTDIPEIPGWWKMKCAENNHRYEEMLIQRRMGVLWVNCPYLGWYPLRNYHFGLTDISWLKKGAGRPKKPRGEARTILAGFKVSQRENFLIGQASEKAKVTRSKWMRDAIISSIK